MTTTNRFYMLLVSKPPASPGRGGERKEDEMSISDYMQWADEQWRVYEQATVTIKLVDLDRFVTAMELLRDGARLTNAARQAWGTYIPPMFRLLVDECSKISQMEPDEPPAILGGAGSERRVG